MGFQPIVILLTLNLPRIIDSSELKLVQVICRHGDRAPIAGYEQWYPTDPHINEKYAPAGLGGLTEEGRIRSFAAGEFLRSRYFPQLQMSPDYSSSFFRIRSSDVERCKKSAEAISAALFPGSKSIPIHTEPLLKDPLFVGIHICPTFKPEMARAKKSMRPLEGDENWPSLREYLNENLGVNVTKYHAHILHHTLMAQRSLGLPLPSWTNKIYPSEELGIIAAHEYVLQSYNTKLKRVNGGLWIREFVKNMENVVSGKDLAKLIVYVGHETNIAGFLSALDVFQPYVPSFSSCVNLEMHEDSESYEHYVRLFYKNYEKFEELQIRGCSLPCSLRDFKFLTNHLIPRNIKKECGLRN